MNSARLDAALANCAHEAHSGSAQWHGLCLKFARTMLGIGPRYSSAIAAWNGAAGHHHGDADPAGGVPVFWRVGRYGHVAISAGGGWCWSTDIKRRGQVDKVPIGYISKHWGAHYLGWSDQLNGVDL